MTPPEPTCPLRDALGMEAVCKRLEAAEECLARLVAATGDFLAARELLAEHDDQCEECEWPVGLLSECEGRDALYDAERAAVDRLVLASAARGQADGRQPEPPPASEG